MLAKIVSLKHTAENLHSSDDKNVFLLKVTIKDHTTTQMFRRTKL